MQKKKKWIGIEKIKYQYELELMPMNWWNNLHCNMHSLYITANNNIMIKFNI